MWLNQTVHGLDLNPVHKMNQLQSLAICENYRDVTFQEISWNQEISDRKKELQEKWNSVSR